ncbi:AAA family ATPase [Tractidigestivibacter scatoligenes]|nr:AAA family ATPase [Tractidigestivibacter scatoligenes]
MSGYWGGPIAFTDGSFFADSGRGGAGVVLYVGDHFDLEAKSGDPTPTWTYHGPSDPMAESAGSSDGKGPEYGNAQLAGEFDAVRVLLAEAVKRNLKGVTIVHDLMGVSEFALGLFQARAGVTKSYVKDISDFMTSHPNFELRFVWVHSHAGNGTFAQRGNQLADQLAKQGAEDKGESESSHDKVDDTGFVTVGRRSQKTSTLRPIPMDSVLPGGLADGRAISRRCDEIKARLGECVKGQAGPIENFCTGIEAALVCRLVRSRRKAGGRSGDDKRPLGVFTFCGPSGVGKSFLSEKAAEELESYGFCYHRFDMSGYMDHESANYLVGFPKTYKDARSGDLTRYVRENPQSVIVFDEIEKAHEQVKHLFLQVLQEGELYDNYEEKNVSFSDTILIFTTNAGRAAYEGETGTDLSGIPTRVIVDAIGKDRLSNGAPAIPSALLSRLAAGNVIMFNRLGARDLLAICNKEFDRMGAQYLETSNIEVTHDEYVPTAILLSKGGLSDARSVRGDTEKFVTENMGELFHSLDEEARRGAQPDRPQKVEFSVNLEGIADERIRGYFTGKRSFKVACLANPSNATREKLKGNEVAEHTTRDGKRVEFLYPRDLGFGEAPENRPSLPEVVDKLDSCDAVLIDFAFGWDTTRPDDSVRFYDAMDLKTYGRRCFEYLRARKPLLPVFVIRPRGGWHYPSKAERQSFLEKGARGFIDTEKSSFFEDLCDAIDVAEQEKDILSLARARKVLEFRTVIPRARRSGLLSSNAYSIRLDEFSLSVAPDSGDADDVLNGLDIPEDSFDDVIGNRVAVDSLKKASACLRDPYPFLDNSLSMPRGILLYGSPGTGKTMMARAMAHDADAVFIPTEANKLLNGGSREIHRIFGVARRYAPSIIFIDEFDNIGQPRERLSVGGQAVVNALLTEMDGFKNDSTRPVMVLAATNFSPSDLDAAAMRRFDTKLLITVPGDSDRERLIMRAVARIPALGVNKEGTRGISAAGITYLVNETRGWSPAKIVDLINFMGREALLADDNSSKSCDAWVRELFELHEYGEAHEVSKEDEKAVAVHESGHALVAYVSGIRPRSITNIARSWYLGLTKVDLDTHSNRSLASFLANVRVSLGGRAAECDYFGSIPGKGSAEGINTGARADLQNATQNLLRALCQFGLDRRFGMAIYPNGQYSPSATERVNGYLDYEFSEACRIIQEHKDALYGLSTVLSNKRYLSGDEIKGILEEYHVKFDSYVPAEIPGGEEDDGR